MRPLIMKLATKISVEAKSYTGITVNDPEYRILEPVVTDEMACRESPQEYDCPGNCETMQKAAGGDEEASLGSGCCRRHART